MNSNFAFALIKSLHHFFSQEVEQDPAVQQLPPIYKLRLISVSTSFSLLINFVNQTTNTVVKQVFFKIPLEEEFHTKSYFVEICKRTRRSETIMKNIRVDFAIIVGSFPLKVNINDKDQLQQILSPDLASVGPEALPPFEIKDFTSATFPIKNKVASFSMMSPTPTKDKNNTVAPSSAESEQPDDLQSYFKSA